jgi:hypothetical protein
MPISIDYNREDNIIYSKAAGKIKLDDILSYYSAVASLDLKQGYRIFADYSDAILELSNEDIYSLTKRRRVLPVTNGKINMAIFCKKDFVFGMARMFEGLVSKDKYNTMVFRSREEAKEWLGI